eukprot:CAMPEP_0117896256 /NCGR_PEP_ID=MMETSP0950-20121206/27145_1 /TAXON_ID=44440 /ORGANISM="Chattonella subsalsa, Strain CCMP2191" /LENGTH=90 /DNA_ID=CAMNT_0005757335 /DNA_START=947 /DNA_END=1219 /DNA_ORIENTATION=-
MDACCWAVMAPVTDARALSIKEAFTCPVGASRTLEPQPLLAVIPRGANNLVASKGHGGVLVGVVTFTHKSRGEASLWAVQVRAATGVLGD